MAASSGASSGLAALTVTTFECWQKNIELNKKINVIFQGLYLRFAWHRSELLIIITIVVARPKREVTMSSAASGGVGAL